MHQRRLSERIRRQQIVETRGRHPSRSSYLRRTNSRRYEYRRSRDTARFNTDVIRRRANRKPGRRCMTSRRLRRRSRSCGHATSSISAGRRLVRFVSVAVDARRKHLAPRVSFLAGLRSSAAKRAGRHTPGPVCGVPVGPRLGGRHRLNDSTLSNRPCADRYAVEAGAKDGPAARKIRRF